jgi:hypothetical protein
MCTWLPVRVERLWWLRGLRRLLLVLGTLPRVLRRDCNASIGILSRPGPASPSQAKSAIINRPVTVHKVSNRMPGKTAI